HRRAVEQRSLRAAERPRADRAAPREVAELQAAEATRAHGGGVVLDGDAEDDVQRERGGLAGQVAAAGARRVRGVARQGATRAAGGAREERLQGRWPGRGRTPRAIVLGA